MIDGAVYCYTLYIVIPVGFLLTISAKKGSDDAKYYTWFRWVYYGFIRHIMNLVFNNIHTLGTLISIIPGLSLLHIPMGWAFISYYEQSYNNFIGKPYYDKFVEFLEWCGDIVDIAIESFKATLPKYWYEELFGWIDFIKWRKQIGAALAIGFDGSILQKYFKPFVEFLSKFFN